MNCWSTRTSERRTLAAEDMPGARDESDTVSETSLTPAVPSGQVGEAIRGRFPVFRDKVYVNSCSQGALSDAVRAAYDEYLAGWDENGAEWEHWVERSEAARAAFAGLLGAAPDDVAIQTSVSAAVSGLVSSLQFRGERNRIVISRNEFPTIGQIAHAQELRGAEVVQVEPDPEAYATVIDERTALVCSTFVSYRTGAVHDVEAIYVLAREHGALMLVDGYQGIGALPLEAAKAGDVVVGGTVKYLLASAGLAFMALRPGLVEELVPVQTGWFADENVFDMQIERYRPHRSARRFDAGTPPVPNIYAGVAGVGLIREVGVEAIQEHVRGLVARLVAGLDELDAKVATPPLGPLVCVRSTDAPAFVAALAEDDIVTSERDSSLRISLHLYNTEDDVDAVLAALARNRRLIL
jgi:selenocysteine lyase/cysteine desulfurase